MIFKSNHNAQEESDSTTESPHHLCNFEAPQPKLLKEIREAELYLKISKRKLDDCDNLSLLSDIALVSSDVKFPLTDTDLRKEVLNDLDRKPTDGCSKKSQRHFKEKTNTEKKLEKKLGKKKMNSFLFLLSTIFLVRDFIDKLRNLSFLRSTSQLKKDQIDMIGDKSYIKEKNSMFTFELMNQKFGERFLILDPSKNFSIFLDFVILFSLSYYFLMIPLHFTYKSFAVNNLKVKFDSIAFYILFLDILRTFRTAFYLKGKLVYSSWKIAFKYLNRGFLFDCLSLTPAFLFILDIYTWDFQYFLIFFYLKIKNFKKIITRLEQLLLTNRKFHHGLSLIKLITSIIFFTHSFACVWNCIGLIGNQYFERTWLKENDLENSDPIEQYLFSYYFVCVTMNTVGFGDISPTNKLEVSFCIVFIFLACGIFAYCINSIGIILTDISRQQDEYRKDLNTINDYMKKKKISFDLRMRIRKFLEYTKKEKKMHEDKEIGETIDKLSDSLREELLLEANGSILKRINFFSFNFSEETLRKTMMIMKEKRFTPGDIIFEKGDYQDTKLYIIKTGEVELLFGNSSHLTTVLICKKGDTFGEFSFFSGQEQGFSARSIDFTTAFVIDKMEFLAIINKVNKDFEKFNEIKEKLVLYNDISPLHMRCFCCHHSSHRIEKCPIIHYCPKKQIMINKFLFNDRQEREHYRRKRNLKSNNLLLSKMKNNKRLQDAFKQRRFLFESIVESEEKDDEKDMGYSSSYSLLKFEFDKIKSFDSLKSQTDKSGSSSKLKILMKNNIDSSKDDDFEEENEKSSFGLAVINSEEQNIYNEISRSNSLTAREKRNQNIFFDIMNFDKLGFFSNYFPNNDIELILKKIELRRISLLKQFTLKRKASLFSIISRSKNIATIHSIDETFVKDGNIRINPKTVRSFNEDQKKKVILRALPKHMNLKKNFFKRIEESPEEIKRYFRAKLKNKGHFLKKKMERIWEKIRMCMKKILH